MMISTRGRYALRVMIDLTQQKGEEKSCPKALNMAAEGGCIIETEENLL